MYKLIASDMDETFLDGHHQIPPANLPALKRLRELGVLFVPSSGRGYLSIMDNFEDIDPALMEGTYVISYNGGSINRFGDPDPIFSHNLDHDLADDLWRFGCERGLSMHVYTPDGRILVQGMTESESRYLASLRRIEEVDLPDLSSVPVVSKMIYMNMDFDWLHEFGANVVDPMLDGRATITYSSGRYLEVNPLGCDKGEGLRKLAEILGVDIAGTIAFGDSANDREMIAAAGLGVGVANVTDDVRPVCDLVLDTTGPDGALPELVERVIEPQHR